MPEMIQLDHLGLHFRDGWYFARRGMNGDVLLCRTGPTQGRADLLLTIDDNSWASIVSSVSAQGENGERWKAALSFHNTQRGTQCPSSEDGHHHLDTSMESGSNNCFHCDGRMP